MKSLNQLEANGTKSQSSKIKVLFVGPVPPPYGGVGAMMENLFRAWTDQRYEIVVQSTSKPADKTFWRDRLSIYSALFWIKETFRLTRNIIRHRPKIVYVTATADLSLIRDASFFLISKIFLRKVVCHFHGKTAYSFFLRSRLRRACLRIMFYLPDATIVLTPRIKEFYTSMMSAHKLYVMGNAIDVNAFALCARQPFDAQRRKINRPAYRTLYSGRLTEEKGIWEALNAVLIMKERNLFDVQLMLLGTAESREMELEIKEFCVRNNLNDSVILLGAVYGKQKIDVFCGADVFLMPSHIENMPLVILEAMAAGVPIVATSVGQVHDMVKDNVNGFLIEPGDAKQLAERTTQLLLDDELRRKIGQQNLQTARSKYDIKESVLVLGSIFNSLLEKKAIT